LLLRIWVLVTGLLLGLGAPAFATDKVDCPHARLPALALPHVKQALTHNQELTIVALGSSSTAGARASDIAHAYPAVLQAELQKALPASHIVVINRGVGGQDAAEELPRLDRDAVAVAPSLVIWQVGANGAMRGADPDTFKRLVASGVHRLESAGIDVVLMDNQRSPAVLASAVHGKIDLALAEVAVHRNAGLVPRGKLMDAWQEEGFPYADFLADDGVHHNDRGYACLARALATAIVDGLAADPSSKILQSASAR
jgi:acyl-CoA thioesterase I